MTPMLTKQDCSPAREWIEVGSKLDIAAVSSWGGQIGQGTFGSLSDNIRDYLVREGFFESEDVGSLSDNIRDYLVREGFFESEDVRASTETQAEFEQLAAKWKQETAHLSSPNMIAEHRAYQEIIGMGQEAIHLILRDLQQTQAQWFWALRSIARESPIQPEDRGDVDAMTVAWLDWGKRHRYIDP